MVQGAGEDTSTRARRIALRWGILLGVLLLGFGATVVTLNSTLYSPSGFVSSYLDALARYDLDGALSMPGVDAPDGALTTLLTPDALGQLTSHTLVSDKDAGDGRHELTFAVHFVDEIRAEITFAVQHTGPRMGVFSGWEFARSPLGVLEATPRHDASFEVNGVAITSADGPGQPSRLAVVTPGIYTLTHDSKYLSAEKATYLADDSVGVTAADIDIQASEVFVEQANRELADYLDECAAQQVLLPSDCPFGQEISNRIEGLPEWSISSYPEVEIVPGEDPGSWAVPPTTAAAHLTVEVRSLFDGTLSTLDEDVPFTVEYVITFPGDGSLQITPR